jgi:hypothetical protein
VSAFHLNKQGDAMIHVVHDGEGLSVREECCFCAAPTNHWCPEKDVAVCEACAPLHTVDQVPSKQEWCAQVRAKMDAQNRLYGWPIRR